jgi:hypothetical protein
VPSSFTKQADPAEASRAAKATLPKGLQIHMILDNYGTHTHDDVVACLDKPPGSTCISSRRRAHG